MKAGTRKALTAGSTFCVALGIGFVMQYGDALASRLGVDEPIAGPDKRVLADRPIVNAGNLVSIPQPPLPQPPAPRGSADGFEVAAIPQEMATPTLSMPVVTDALPVATPAPVTPDSQVLTEAPTLSAPAVADCKPVMTAAAQPLAMVRLTLTDACHASSAVTIHHQGMMFSALLDDAGALSVDVPALARDALFIADFKTGKGAAASILVPDLDAYDRAVLQWQGDDGLQIHALEFGAGYDDAGHIWAASAGSLAQAQAGAGGVLTTLGDPAVSDALQAEVYTYPSGQSARDGEVLLNVEAEITSRNCGRDVAAQSIQIGPGHPAKAIDLTMTMPGCDAVGEFLVLKNMFADLTLAAK